jgi:predicted  nucleic acid-binding Zn-ribbon protein
MAAHLIAVGVVGVDPARADREVKRMKSAATAKQRQAEERAAKLADVKDQVATGTLVIRRMSSAERKAWAARRSATAARSTPTELAARDAALERRRGQAERRADGL